MTLPAGYEYYHSILGMYADWGVDFIKADDMSRPYRVDEVHALRKAMQESGRDMVLSLSPGAANIMAANDLRQNAHMWRISNDIWDSWDLMLRQFTYTANWAPYIVENHWPDADMLPLGKLRKNGVGEWEAGLLNDKMENVKDEYSRLSKDEQVIWAADDPSDETAYLALFNIGELPTEVTFNLEELQLGSRLKMKDIWSKEETIKTGSLVVILQPHSSVLYKVTHE